MLQGDRDKSMVRGASGAKLSEIGLLLVLLLTDQLVFSGMFRCLALAGTSAPQTSPHPHPAPLALPSITLLLHVPPPRRDVGGIRAGRSPLLDALALPAADGGHAMLGEFGARSHGPPVLATPPAQLHSGCAVRGSFVARAGQMLLETSQCRCSPSPLLCLNPKFG